MKVGFTVTCAFVSLALLGALPVASIADNEVRRMLLSEDEMHTALSMIDSGLVDVDSKDEEGSTLLYEAARAGAIEATKELLRRGANVNVVGFDALRPIDVAAQYGHPLVVGALLAAGATISRRTVIGLTYPAAHGCSAEAQDYVAVFELLRRHGVAVELAGSAMDEMLRAAIRAGAVEAVVSLVWNGAAATAAARNEAVELAVSWFGADSEMARVLLRS